MEKQNNSVLAVAMSGGVDSSVAAALLVKHGYQAIGMTMHVWDFESVGGNINNESTCYSVEAMNDAKIVCHKLGIPHYTINLKPTFKDQIIQNFIDEYLAGRTPNPCILCNREIKWGALLRKAEQLGADKIATGHYARCLKDEKTGRLQLLRGIDRKKDQVYALWTLTQEQLKKTLLPLGTLTKQRVRAIANELGLKTAPKPESQEICFIPDNNYERFLKEQIPNLEERLKNGKIIDEAGNVLGYHRGYPFYTIGQRRGLQIATGRRVYVRKIDPKMNRIHVGDKASVRSDGLIAHSVNWVSIPTPEKTIAVSAKIRYNDPGFSAKLTPLAGNRIKLDFEKPQKAVTPGQSAVFYGGDLLLGGGFIEKAY